MILLYRVLMIVFYPLIILITFFRIFFKKEDSRRYKEKIFSSHFKVKRDHNRKLIWFHAASIGEFKSILPIIEKLHSSVEGNDFLITTSTLSSSKIATKELRKYKLYLDEYNPSKIEFIKVSFQN